MLAIEPTITGAGVGLLVGCIVGYFARKRGRSDERIRIATRLGEAGGWFSFDPPTKNLLESLSRDLFEGCGFNLSVIRDRFRQERNPPKFDQGTDYEERKRFQDE